MRNTEEVICVAGEAPEAPEVTADLSALKLPKTVPELLKLARAEIKENNAENALAIIHSVLEQESKNAEAHRLREEAEKEIRRTGLPAQCVAARSCQDSGLA